MSQIDDYRQPERVVTELGLQAGPAVILSFAMASYGLLKNTLKPFSY
jgi:hypothetical protein